MQRSLPQAIVRAAILSLVPCALLYWPSLTFLAKCLGIAYPAVAAAIGLLADLRTTKPKRITKAGLWALALGIAAFLTNGGVMVVESVRQDQSAAAAIRHQSQVIDNLRRLVAPLTDQISASVSLSIPADQAPVSGMSTYLNEFRGKNRYAGLPRILHSEEGRERFFAELVSLTVAYLYFCKGPSCIEALEKGDRPDNPQILLSGQLMISRPELTQLGIRPPFQVELDTNRQILVLDGEQHVFNVTLQDLTVKFDESERGFHSADDLPKSTLVASITLGGMPNPRFSLGGVVLRKRNGMFLQAKDFVDMSRSDGHAYRNFLVAKLDERWR